MQLEGERAMIGIKGIWSYQNILHKKIIVGQNNIQYVSLRAWIMSLQVLLNKKEIIIRY